MKRLLFVLFLLTSAVYSQNVEKVRNFKGLDTRTSDRTVENNYARVAHNPDFSRILGEIAKRRGYKLVDSLAYDTILSGGEQIAYDSLMALYPVYLADGKQALIYGVSTNNSPSGINSFVDSTGWGTLFMTRFGSADLDSSYKKWGITWSTVIPLYDYWNQAAQTYFTTFNDIVYASNGTHRGVAIDIQKQHSATWPLPAPGEPRVTSIAAPQSADTFQLNGEYRYILRAKLWDADTAITTLNGVVTSPVRVTDGHILLSDFQFMPDNASSSFDSMHVRIYRTKANPGRLDEADSASYLGDSYVFRSIGTTCSTKIFIDSVADNKLTDTGLLMIDPAKVAQARRYGAPTYISVTDSAYRRADSARQFIWGGGPGANMDVVDTNILPLGYAYMTVFEDTLLNIQSDSSRATFVYQPSGKLLRSVRLGIPKLPTTLTNTIRKLYRAMVMYSGRDTSLAVQSFCNTDRTELQNEWNIVNQMIAKQNVVSGLAVGNVKDILNGTLNGATGNNYYLSEIRKAGNGWCFDKLQRTQTRDTIVVTPFILVDDISNDSVAFTDSVRTDSLIMHQWYFRRSPPPFLTSIFGYGNYIFGIAGSNLYQSVQDTAGFGAFSFVAVSPDDGDVGTFARPTRTGIRFYKNNKSFTVYQDADGVYRQYELVNGIGMIAPQSGVLTPYGFAYLSGSGVMLETEGEALERVYKSGIISSRLDNFDKMSIAVKSKAKGVYADNKYILYVPAPIDTAYVYDFLADAWSTWSLPISGAALYGTETTVSHLPGDTLFFYKPNSRTLYKFGVGETDDGDSITTTWQSVPLLADGYINQILKIGTWTTSPTEVDLTGLSTTEQGVVVPNITFSSDMTDKYQVRELGPQFKGLYTQLSVVQSADTTFSIGGFDIYWRQYEDILSGIGAVATGDTFTYPTGGSGIGDITQVVAGDGMTGGGTSGTVTLHVGSSTTITVNDDNIEVDTTVVATRGFVRDSSGVGVVADSVMYADSSAYADTAGVALNGGSTDSIYVKRTDSFNTSGWVGGDDTLFVDTTGGVGGGMSMDSTTAGNGLIESANDLAVRPGYGIDTVGDLVRVDSTEFASVFRLRDTAAAVRVDVRDTVNIMGITDSSTAGNGLGETGNDIYARPGYGIDTVGDLIRVDSAEFASLFRLRDTAAAVRADIRDTVGVLPISTLSDVDVTSPDAGQLLSWNGSNWVNIAATATSGTGVITYYLDDSISFSGGSHKLLTTPNTSTEEIDPVTITPANDTLLVEFYCADSSFGTTTVEGGVWDFETFGSVNSSVGTSYMIHRVGKMVMGTGTVTTTGTGTARTVTVTGGTPFVADDDGATELLTSYIEFDGGGGADTTVMITGYTSSSVVTISCQTGFVNKTSASYHINRHLFTVSSPEINNTTSAYIGVSSVQPAFTVNATDRLCVGYFAQSSVNNRIVRLVHNGTTYNSHIHTPLIRRHNNLAGLQGGSAGQYYHTTSAQADSIAALTTNDYLRSNEKANTAALADSTSGGAARAELADSTQGGAARAELADSTGGGAARAEIADSLTGFDENVADKVGAMVTGNTESQITVAYQDADNTLDFTVGVVDSATGAARAQRADSARTVGTIPASRLDSTGVTNNYVVKKTAGGVVWAAQDVLTDFTDVFGTLTVHGQLPVYNEASDPDLRYIKMTHADTNFYQGHMLPYYMRQVADTTAGGLRRDSLDFVHPSGFYDPNGTLAGWKYLMSFTGARATNIIEEPFIRVSNNGREWWRYARIDSLVQDSVKCDSLDNEGEWVYEYCPVIDTFWTNATDTLWPMTLFPDSIAFWDGTKYDVKYPSDNEMIHGHDGKVHMYLRGSAVNGADVLKSSAIYHRSSSDLITWSDTVESIPWNRGIGFAPQLLSPCVFLGQRQTYVMLAIETKEVTGAGADSTSLILRYESQHPDTGWVLTDTVRDTSGNFMIFGKNGDNRLLNDAYAWHLDVVDWGPDSKIVIFNAKHRIGSDTTFSLYIGKSRNDFKTMEVRYDPILTSGVTDGSYSTSCWDGKYIYKATGWRLNKGDRDVLQICYSAYTAGATDAGFHTGMAEAEFMTPISLDFSEVAGRRNAPGDSVTLTFPSWADSASGIIDRWVDSTSAIAAGSDRQDFVFHRATAARPFQLDTLILSNFITTDSGTGRANASNVCIDSITIWGPDLSAGTNAADSVWWNSPTNRTADTRTTVKVALNLNEIAPAGSVFRIVIVNKLAAAQSAVHMERVAIKGRER